MRIACGAGTEGGALFPSAKTCGSDLGMLSAGFSTTAGALYAPICGMKSEKLNVSGSIGDVWVALLDIRRRYAEKRSLSFMLKLSFLAIE